MGVAMSKARSRSFDDPTLDCPVPPETVGRLARATPGDLPDLVDGIPEATRARLAVWLLAAVLALVGATLLVGGTVLVRAGGSAYYLAAGLLVSLTAAAVLRRSRLAFLSYGVLLAGTLAWSLWEVGLGGWALAPRLLGPAVLGLVSSTGFLFCVSTVTLVVREANAAPASL